MDSIFFFFLIENVEFLGGFKRVAGKLLHRTMVSYKFDKVSSYFQKRNKETEISEMYYRLLRLSGNSLKKIHPFKFLRVF